MADKGNPIGYWAEVDDHRGREVIKAKASEYRKRAYPTRQYKRSVSADGQKIPIRVLIVYEPVAQD